MKIVVFDTGIGGQAVAEQLEMLLPGSTVVVVNDHDHMPYGTRSNEEIIELTDTAIAPLITDCDVVLIACNTATTVALPTLRRRHPDVSFVGIEPMVKPAALQTVTRHIAVLATPATLASRRYQELVDEWASDVTVHQPNCSDWAQLIENGNSHMVPIEQTVSALLDQSVDVIVLGCTHYHWLKERAERAADGRAVILEPSQAIAERIIDLMGHDQTAR